MESYAIRPCALKTRVSPQAGVGLVKGFGVCRESNDDTVQAKRAVLPIQSTRKPFFFFRPKQADGKVLRVNMDSVAVEHRSGQSGDHVLKADYGSLLKAGRGTCMIQGDTDKAPRVNGECDTLERAGKAFVFLLDSTIWPPLETADF